MATRWKGLEILPGRLLVMFLGKKTLYINFHDPYYTVPLCMIWILKAKYPMPINWLTNSSHTASWQGSRLESLKDYKYFPYTEKSNHHSTITDFNFVLRHLNVSWTCKVRSVAHVVLYVWKYYEICDRICEKVPFPHILHTSKQNDVTLDSLYSLTFP